MSSRQHQCVVIHTKYNPGSSLQLQCWEFILGLHYFSMMVYMVELSLQPLRLAWDSNSSLRSLFYTVYPTRCSLHGSHFFMFPCFYTCWALPILPLSLTNSYSLSKTFSSFETLLTSSGKAFQIPLVLTCFSTSSHATLFILLSTPVMCFLHKIFSTKQYLYDQVLTQDLAYVRTSMFKCMNG